MLKVFKLLITINLAFITGIDAQENNNIYCFENPFMYIEAEKKIKVSSIRLNLEDVDEKGKLTHMIYSLENGHTYSIDDLLCSYDARKDTYFCGVECDGGFLEFDRKNNVLFMDGIRTLNIGLRIPELMDNNTLVGISNPERGWLSTGFIDENESENNRNEKVWVYGSKCAKEEPKLTPVYYTVHEYENTFPLKKDRLDAFESFYDAIEENKEEGLKVEVVELRKPYRDITTMMEGEGFNFDWLKVEDIELFVYSIDRALVLVVSSDENCAFSGYYLMELKGNKLIKQYVGLGHGDISPVVIFEMEK